MLKWAGALAGAAVVGVVAGLETDILARPNTTTTTTTTSTVTNTVAPPTLSFKPPLSTEVKTRVDAIKKGLVDAHAGETKYYATTFAAAGSGPVQLVVKNGVVVGVVPEDIVNPTIAREDAYISADDLAKGRIRGIPWGGTWTYPSMVNSPTRLLYPMKRTGPRGDPNNAGFVRITWDEAISTTVQQIQQCKAKYGPYSVETGGICYGHHEPYLIDYGVECSGGYGCSSQGNNWFSSWEVFGPYSGSGANLQDLANSKLIVLWAADVTTGGHATYKGYLLWMALAKEKGIPIVVIDVKYTDSAETWADQWIPIRPGTDMAMMLAVANVLFKENLYNADYVAKYVELTGFQKWKDYVLGKSPGYMEGTSPDGAIDRTPEWAAPICGVPADTIRAFARLYGNSKPTALVFGTGGQRQTRGMNQARASMYLQAMTGNVGVPGGSAGGDGLGMTGYLASYNLPFMPGAYGIPDGGWISYTQPTLHSEVATVEAIIQRDDYVSGKITKDQYYRAIGNNIKNPAPNIHILYNLQSGHSPGPTMANVNRALQAVKKVDFFISGTHNMDGWYGASDIVLPMQENGEMSSFFVDTERGIIYIKQILSSPGDVRDLNWFRMQVAKGLGVADNFAQNYLPGMKDTTYDKWEAGVQAMLSQTYATWVASDAIKPVLPNAPTYSQLQTAPVLRADLMSPQPYPFQSQIAGGKPFSTKSGKIEFYDPNLEQFDTSKVFSMNWAGYGGPIAPMAIWQPPEEGYTDPRAAKYPLVMRDTHPRFSTSGSAGWADSKMSEVYRHSVWMNPADAKQRGIVDGDKVEVFNDRGTISLAAYVTSRQTPGSVFIHCHMPYLPNNQGVDNGGCTNVLNSDSSVIAPAGQEATNALVEVRKA